MQKNFFMAKLVWLSGILTYFLIFLSTINAQENNPVQTQAEKMIQKKPVRETVSVSNRNPDASYLDIFHAKDKSKTYQKVNFTSLFRLRIISENFGTEEDKKRIKELLTKYETAVLNRYKRKYVSSEKLHLEIKREMKEIFNKMANKYQSQTMKILDECANKIIEIEMAETMESISRENSKIKLLSKNRIRLELAFNRIVKAEEMQLKERPESSIDHFRVAKFYGINILEDLAPNEKIRKKITDQYSVDKQDIRNLIAK